jgi:hypothetical protein
MICFLPDIPLVLHPFKCFFSCNVFDIVRFLIFSTNLSKNIVIVGKDMEQLFQNENRSLDIFMNEVERNNEPFEKRSNFFSNPQTKSNKISQIEKEPKNL